MSDSRPIVVAAGWILLALCLAAASAAVLIASTGARSAWLLFLGALVLGVWAVFLFIALSRDPTRRKPSGRPGAVVTTHTLAFEVGEREKHSVVFTFDQMWGWLTITVDDRMIARKFITFSFRLLRVFEFVVGGAEPHTVRIEKSRPLLVSFARPQPTRAFCDGVLVAEASGVA
ncbi:hypothetical protein [Leifsonia xyli]|uniref:hypothetical protein n=1 Tax=Leifsonia xyli TaxID=1575 RepID=UPI003D67C5B1